MKKTIESANLHMLLNVAEKLGDLCDDVVFLGGCTTALFITDIAASDVRPTYDVDCIVDVLSLNQYYKLSEKLRKKEFIIQISIRFRLLDKLL